MGVEDKRSVIKERAQRHQMNLSMVQSTKSSETSIRSHARGSPDLKQKLPTGAHSFPTRKGQELSEEYLGVLGWEQENRNGSQKGRSGLRVEGSGKEIIEPRLWALATNIELPS